VGTVDGMQYVWTGAYPANQCPRIKAGKLKVGREVSFNNGVDRYFRPGTKLLCTIDADDPDGDALTITWDLRIDVSKNTATGGAYEPPSTPIAGAVLSASANTAIIQLPADTNKYYRIFCYVKDPKGSAATANCPIVSDPNAPEPVTNFVSGNPDRGVRAMSVAGRGETAVVRVNLDRQTFMTLEAFSLKGQRIATLDRGLRRAGLHSYALPARMCAAGTYFISLNTDCGTLIKRIIAR
jgi:hypothetical protein